MYTFTHPETGKRHLLRSSPQQKTLRFPGSDEFTAHSYCGCASVTLRKGDLSRLSTPEVDLADDSDWCRFCTRVGPLLPTRSDTDTTDSTDDQQADATA